MVSENCRSAGTAIGDGLGFVLHPLYKPGENRIDSRTGDTTAALLPKYFGRLANLSAINSDPGDGNKQFLGQTIVSPGVAGGDLGMNDLMNVIGFKIDTYKNRNGMELSNGLKTYYDANPDAGERVTLTLITRLMILMLWVHLSILIVQDLCIIRKELQPSGPRTIRVGGNI